MLLNCGVGEDSWESLGLQEDQTNPKGTQSWIFIGRTDAKAETPILWPPDVKNWLLGRDPDDVKDWRQEEKGTTEDEMVEWHHQLNGHEFEQALGVGDGQGNLVCYSPWGPRVGHDWATELNWKYWSFSFTLSPSNKYSGLISFSTDWFGLLGSQPCPDEEAYVTQWSSEPCCVGLPEKDRW